MADFGPLGRIRSSLMGDGPKGRGDLALRGFLGSQEIPGQEKILDLTNF